MTVLMTKLNSELSSSITAAIRIAVGMENSLPLHEPSFESNEWQYVKDCLDSGWVSSVGKYVELFEEELALFTGVKRAIAVVNGTSALHVALLLAGVVEGDEVLVPTITFIATANAVSYLGAVPHFIDSHEKTLGINPTKLEEWLTSQTTCRLGNTYNKSTGRKISALVAVHALGHPVELNEITTICEKFGIVLIEDAAEALGSCYRGAHVGHHGLLSILSFNGNKIATTGGGGAILTNDESLADRAKHITTTAKISHPWEYIHDEIAYNYRMPNLNAALGLAQVQNLPKVLARKRALARRYEEAFEGVSNIRFFSEAAFARSNYWLNAILVESDLTSVLEFSREQGIFARPLWAPLHSLLMYKNCPAMDLTGANELSKRVLTLPSGPKL